MMATLDMPKPALDNIIHASLELDDSRSPSETASALHTSRAGSLVRHECKRVSEAANAPPLCHWPGRDDQRTGMSKCKQPAVAAFEGRCPTCARPRFSPDTRLLPASLLQEPSRGPRRPISTISLVPAVLSSQLRSRPGVAACSVSVHPFAEHNV
jgi:hypothetical protein